MDPEKFEKETIEVLENSEYKHLSSPTGYVSYILYAIATWLACWWNFDSTEIDNEWEDRVIPYALEFIKEGWDEKDRPFCDCLNDFMNWKKFEEETK